MHSNTIHKYLKVNIWTNENCLLQIRVWDILISVVS